MGIRRFFLPLAALSMLLALMVASGSPARATEGTQTGQAHAASPRLPRGIVHVSGANAGVRVAGAGAALCRPTTPAEAAAALAATNALRTGRKLAPLHTDPRLQRAAEVHACEMAQRGVMGHGGASGSGPMARVKQAGYRPRMTAENIAAGHFDMTRVHQEWARSPGHLGNIVIDGLQHHGIGFAVAADGKSIFWAALYASGR
ncbi:MAG: CAP domain-containing protein [Paracoccus sp. (in: a-proteobacteria)]|nr:CAP domain-containing protein [Paracoccus sp. (in: a-proteobacteria)]